MTGAASGGGGTGIRGQGPALDKQGWRTSHSPVMLSSGSPPGRASLLPNTCGDVSRMQSPRCSLDRTGQDLQQWGLGSCVLLGNSFHHWGSAGVTLEGPGDLEGGQARFPKEEVEWP